MAPFICKCEGKSYAGWFNKKICKECGEVIHNIKGIVKGGYAWKTQRIKDLEDTIISICAFIELLDELCEDYGDVDLINTKINGEKLISLVSKARKDIEDNQYKRR